MDAPPHSILFFNRFYWPDVAATGQMLTDLAEDLVVKGWQVTVVTSQSDYHAGAADLPISEEHNGVHIRRIVGTRFGRGRIAGRLLDYLTYFLGSAVQGVSRPRHDVYVALSDPPFIISVALLAGRIKRGKVVYWVQDLFPQVAAALDVMDSQGILYRALLAVSGWLNSHAELVIVLGGQMAKSIAGAGAHGERIAVVQNWSDSRAITPMASADNPFVAANGLVGKFVVLYSGNAGRAHRFDALVYAARALKGEPDIVFVFIGGGHRLPEVKAATAGLGNVRFLGYVDREVLAYSLSAASVSVVTEDTRVVGTLVPSKTYGILASGRPVLFVGSPESDVAAVITSARCGVLVGEDDGEGVVNAIRQLKNDPVRLRELGANARRASVDLYDRAHGTRNWEQAVLRSFT
ncbi:MAG: glycosyltransferase [Gemmatimonadetes bacterium]|nr:glycosyltransferase [Gemmatimonadota bacterium]